LRHAWCGADVLDFKRRNAPDIVERCAEISGALRRSKPTLTAPEAHVPQGGATNAAGRAG
jgi:hypothetical protein